MKSELVPTDGGPAIPITRDVTVLGRRRILRHPHRPSQPVETPLCAGADRWPVDGPRLASTNGTKVNGQKVMWAALLPNDRVTLGRCKFRVFLGPDDQPGPSERQRSRSPGAVAAPLAWPAPPAGFAPLSPMPAAPFARAPGGSTDPDSDYGPEALDEFAIEDDDPPFSLELD